LSENIRVISVIGRFLEHSRIFYFRNAAEKAIDGSFFIGSADWMYRNLHARIEACAPIEDLALRERLWEILDLLLKDRRQAWELKADGTYTQFQPKNAEDALGTHAQLMALTKARNKTTALE
jgi:polyphosphate kinase